MVDLSVVATRRSRIDIFLEHALAGDVDGAVALALQMLDDGLPGDRVVTDLLVPAQLEVGARWEANRLASGQEHVASRCVEAVLHALSAAGPRPTGPAVLLACASGEWHAVTAHLFAVQLQSRGVAVRFIGASAAPDDLVQLIGLRRPSALVVSCSMPGSLFGVTPLADAAHVLGLPVLVGGPALPATPAAHDAVRRLGGDAWAADLVSASSVLEQWRHERPSVSGAPTVLAAAALELERRSAEIAEEHSDVDLVVRALAAAELVDDDQGLVSVLDWLQRVRDARGVPRERLRDELRALAGPVGEVSPGVVHRLRRAQARCERMR